MKKILDFSKVPLDKWRDLYWAVHNDIGAGPGVNSLYKDIAQIATVEVKEESDIDKEIAEELLANDGSPSELTLSLLRQKKEMKVKKEAENISSSEQKKRDGGNQG